MSANNEPRAYYVTTSIPYANAVPHVGHTFEMIGADVVARAKRMLGYDVYFQIGTDEHGQKMLEYADKAGKSPREYADEVSPRHRQLWDELGISYDRFIRTVDPDHHKAVHKFWNAIAAKGDIYLDHYSGWYCVTDENFVLESQATAGPGDAKICPECGTQLTWKSESSYFFRWSKYQHAIEQYLAEHPNFIAPHFRANEMINSFLKPGLQDISISRSTIKWGIPVPDAPDHVIYVWFDALINYITGVGYGDDPERFARYWPADLHIVGKDIFKFHTLLWPAMCMAAGIYPPKRVFGHGFVSPKAMATTGEVGEKPAGLRDSVAWEIVNASPVTVEVKDNGQLLGIVVCPSDSTDAIKSAILAQFGERVIRLAKMSKSRGNVVDPRDILNSYNQNPDPLRYFLMREIDFGNDGVYSNEALATRYNADLADKLGNLLSRTLTMVGKYQDGMVVRPEPEWFTDDDIAVRNVVVGLFGRAAEPSRHSTEGDAITEFERLIDGCEYSHLLEKIMASAQRLNLYITEQQPFKLAKDPAQTERLKAILYTLCEGLRLIAVQLYPFIPSTAEKIWTQLGAEKELSQTPFEELSQWGHLDNAKVTRGENLFPKE